MAGNDTLRFYYPWPAYGVKMSRQWPNVRENFQALAPLVRAAYVDLQPASAHDPGENDLSGWAIGERDFRNKFRIWYSKTEDMFKIQYNNGTEAVPAWNDAIQIRESDLRLTVTGAGGVAAPTGGFYTDIPRQLAVSRDFALSSEWQFQHNLNARPIIWDAFRSNYQSIVPNRVDVSNPNIAYFYFSTPVAGTAIAVAEQARGNGINFTDGTNIYYNKLVLNVNSTDFYISRNLQGNPVLNLLPVDLSESQHSTLGGLTADDHPQYVRTDGTRAITGPQIFNDSIHVKEHVQAYGSFYSKAFGEVAYANQGYLTVTQTNGAPEFTTVNKLTFEQSAFYLTSDSQGKPIVNFRGSSASGGGGQFGTGIQSQTFSSSTEWQFAHGLGVNQIIWAVYDDQGEAIIPNKVDSSNTSTMFFYFTEAVAGRAVVAGGPLVNTITVVESDGTPTYNTGTLKFSSADFYIQSDTNGYPIVNVRSGGSGGSGSGSGVTDHGALTGLSDDDHSQYILADGTRKFTGVLQGSLRVAQRVHAAEGFYGGFGQFNTNVHIGNLGTEDGGVNLGGTTHNASLKVSDIGPSDFAMFHLHRHSAGSGVYPAIVATRSKSNTSSHTAVGNGDVLLAEISAGWTSGRYDEATRIEHVVDGTPGGGAGDLPGAIVFKTSTPGSGTPAEAMRIRSDKHVSMGNSLNVKNVVTAEAFYLQPGSGGEISKSGNDIVIRSTNGNVKIQDAEVRQGKVIAEAFYLRNGASMFRTSGFGLKLEAPGYLRADSTGNMAFVAGDDLFLNATGDAVQTVGGNLSWDVTGNANLTVTGSMLVSSGAAFAFSSPSGVFVSNLDASSTRITSVSTPTASTDAATKGYVDSTRSPGFYGVHFRETDGNPPGFRNDTIYFNSSSFYLSPNSVGKPVLNFRGSAGGGTALTVQDVDGNPTASNVSTIKFTNGSVTDDGGGVVTVSTGGGGGISTVDDSVHSIGSATALGLNPSHFYLSQNGSSKPIINLRYDEDTLQLYSEATAVGNYFIETDAPYPYVVQDASVLLQSGSCGIGFYIVRAGQNKNGIAITGLDPITASSAKSVYSATAQRSVSTGDQIKVSIFSNSSGRQLRVSLRARKPQ